MPTSHYMPSRTEGMIICFFLSHSTSSRRQWMNLNIKHSNSCFLVSLFMIIISSTVRPKLHMAHCNFSISLHSVWHYLLLLALLAQTQDRSSAKKQCLETMLARWKELVKWEKIKKSGRVCERFFSAAVHGFLISYEITEHDELSRVTNPSTRAPPTHSPRSDGAPWIPLIAV